MGFCLWFGATVQKKNRSRSEYRIRSPGVFVDGGAKIKVRVAGFSLGAITCAAGPSPRASQVVSWAVFLAPKKKARH